MLGCGDHRRGAGGEGSRGRRGGGGGGGAERERGGYLSRDGGKGD